MSESIYFRTNWSTSLGFGHLYRMNSLAIRLGVPLVTVSDSLLSESPFKETHRNYGISEGLEIVQKSDWVIIDTYEIQSEEEKQWYESCKVLVIDDNGASFRWCHALLDYAMLDQNHYNSLTPPNTPLYLGPEYLILNPSFVKGSWEYRSHPKFALITVGGGDEYGVTLKLLNEHQSILQSLYTKVIVGPGFSQELIDDINLLSADWKGELELVKSNTLWNDYLYADVILGAYGVSSWERIWMGAPSFNTVIAENQKFNQSLQLKDHLAASGDFQAYIENRKIIHENCLRYLSRTENLLHQILT